jgi:hypothetical protein
MSSAGLSMSDTNEGISAPGSSSTVSDTQIQPTVDVASTPSQSIEALSTKRSVAPSNNGRATLVVLPILLGAATLIAGPRFHSDVARPIMFGLICAFSTLEFMALGYVIKGRLSGVIIDARNCMSLSRLQMCGWTVLVLSAVFVAAIHNISSGAGSPLNIVIPYQLLIAMGISAASLVAAPAVLSLKAAQNPRVADLDSAAGKLDIALIANVPSIGRVMGNSSSADASYTDLFTGDDVSNFDSPDIGKIQQFLITILLLSVYGAAVASSFIGVDATYSLPGIDNGFIWLLGVSHASYLAYKAAPHPSTN